MRISVLRQIIKEEVDKALAERSKVNEAKLTAQDLEAVMDKSLITQEFLGQKGIKYVEWLVATYKSVSHWASKTKVAGFDFDIKLDKLKWSKSSHTFYANLLEPQPNSKKYKVVFAHDFKIGAWGIKEGTIFPLVKGSDAYTIIESISISLKEDIHPQEAGGTTRPVL